MHADSVAKKTDQFLCFVVAGEEYAVGILRVREIIEYDTLTKVPGTPPAVRGVINLRGAVVPVVDLALTMGLPETPVTKWTCIVMVEVAYDGEPITIGVIAESVSQVLDIAAEDIEPPPSFGTRVKLDYIEGMAQAGKKFTLLLNIDKVLSVAQLNAAELAAAVEAHAGEGAAAAAAAQ
jgi:purine-binding chemotaxis protein CheW